MRRAFTFDILPRTSSETDLLGTAAAKRLQRSPRASPTSRPWSPTLGSPLGSPRPLDSSPEERSSPSPPTVIGAAPAAPPSEAETKAVLRGMP